MVYERYPDTYKYYILEISETSVSTLSVKDNADM